MQGIGNAGIDASRRGLGIHSDGQTVLKAEIDAIGAERTFLCHANARRVFALRFVLHAAPLAVGKTWSSDLVTSLIWAGDGAIGAANTDVIVDSNDAIFALAGGRRWAYVHAGRIGAMHATDGHEGARHVRVAAGFEIEHPTPLYCRRGGVGMLACGGAGLAADAAA